MHKNLVRFDRETDPNRTIIKLYASLHVSLAQTMNSIASGNCNFQQVEEM